MKITDLIMLQILLIILLDNVINKIFAIIITIFLLCYLKEKISAKEIVKLVIQGSVLIALNYLVSFNLNYLNFIYFGIISLLCYYGKAKIKGETFLSFYFLLVLIRGVVEVCLSL